MLQFLEGIVKLLVAQLTTVVHVSLFKDGNQSSLKRFDESGRLHINLLTLLDIFGQVLNLHDVVSGHEWINFLSFHIDETSVLEFSAQMQLQLNLKFVLQHAINPLL